MRLLAPVDISHPGVFFSEFVLGWGERGGKTIVSA